MGERNPVYLDRAAALAAGHDDVIAPPAMLQVWTMPGLEPDRPLSAGPARAGDLDESVRARLAEMGYAWTLAASIDQEFLSVVRRGDRLVAEDEYITVSGEKPTRLGPGSFVTNRTTYPGTTAPASAALPPRCSTSCRHRCRIFPAVAAAGRRSGSPARGAPDAPGRRGSGGLCRRAATPTQIISGALATRDFYPVHHDRDFARAHGNRDFLMNILTTNGLLARIVGEWTSQAPLSAWSRAWWRPRTRMTSSG